jgi:2-polyprenyl-3-methyl-5-hydroxy-6-metoxy-1,4-benzoquinol methylase
MQLLEAFYKSKKIKTILDLGCGKCEYIVRLHELGYKAEGLDGFPEVNHKIVSKKDPSKPVSLKKQFDFVQSFEVGEHIFSYF